MVMLSNQILLTLLKIVYASHYLGVTKKTTMTIKLIIVFMPMMLMMILILMPIRNMILNY